MNKVYVDQNCSICSTYGEWISKQNNQLVIESHEMLSKHCLLYTSPSPRD